MERDFDYMARALELAEQALASGEVPVGAVLVHEGVIAGEGQNRPLTSRDPTAHAEILALRSAAANVGNYRLPGSTLYVTVEPCTMCAGALIHARVARLVFAAREARAGAVRSTARVLDNPALNHRVVIEEGLFEARSRELMQSFFRARRDAARGAPV